MKCPKCGYNSFEYNDNCPKCLNDLTGYKATYGLQALVLPLMARTEMARSMAADAHVESHPAEDAGASSDIFSFDFEDDEPGTPAGGGAPAHDPIGFDDKPADSLAPAPGEEDVFSNLLETTPQKSTAGPKGKSAAGAKNDEFDLENFSWDDAPDPAGDGKPAKPREDDFGSLFGDTKK
jgi:hypothetical protein